MKTTDPKLSSRARLLFVALVNQGFTRREALTFLLQAMVSKLCETAGLFVGQPFTYVLEEALSTGDIEAHYSFSVLLNELFSTLPEGLSRPLPRTLSSPSIRCLADYVILVDWNCDSLAQLVSDTYSASIPDDQRRHDGVYYTGTDDIHRCIDDLFLNRLAAKADAVKSVWSCCDLQSSIDELRFLDASSGCGNFLIEIYRSLAELETKLCKRFKAVYKPAPPDNFYGIEKDKTSAWLSRLLMAVQVRSSEIQACKALGQELSVFSLTLTDSIVCADALTSEWQPDVDYIVGNPPFVTSMSEEQISAIKTLDAKAYDYCTGWLVKTHAYMKRFRNTQAAFLLTSSMCQGRSIGFWSAHPELHINFAYQSYEWSGGSADLNCVIVGLGLEERHTKSLHTPAGTIACDHINCCLQPLPEPPVLNGTVKHDRPKLTRSYFSRDICLPEEITGENIPIRFVTAANLLCSEEELTTDYDSDDVFASSKQSPAIVIPRHCSCSRRYIPLSYFDSGDFVANESVLVCESASITLFTILMSAVHQDFVQSLCGRLDSSFRYSSELYYSFPLVSIPPEKEVQLAELGNALLRTRSKLIKEGLALGRLYTSGRMPAELLSLHFRIDAAVDELYFGKPVFRTLDRLKLLYELCEKVRNSPPKKSGTLLQK